MPIPDGIQLNLTTFSHLYVNISLFYSLTAFITDSGHDQLEQTLTDLMSFASKHYTNVGARGSKSWSNENTSIEDSCSDEELNDSLDCNINVECSSDKPDDEENILVALCIELVSFLIGCLEDYQFHSMTSQFMELFVGLLHSPSLHVRIASGECIALIVERFGTDFYDHFSLQMIVSLENELRQLATGGTRFRGKRDLRKQRSTFRDVLRTVEVFGGGGDVTAIKHKHGTVVRFGSEHLLLDTWLQERYYTVFRRILGPSLNRHLCKRIFY